MIHLAKLYKYDDIRVEDIATKCKISERNLRNYFKEELNIFPKQYIIGLRLGYPKEINTQIEAAERVRFAKYNS